MAVYTRVNEDELNAFLSEYDIGTAVSFSGITEGVENSNYRLKTTQGYFILTLYEKRVNPDDLPFFINLMGHMAKRGINCPQPVADRQGQVLKTLNNRMAAMVTFLDGTSNNSPSAQRCHAVGKALAAMHLAGDDFDGFRANALDHQAWSALLASCDDSANTLKSGLLSQSQDRLDGILKEWPSGLPRGVCHADLFPDNVLFTGDDVTGIIDFYFACIDDFAYDLAIMLNAWCFESDGSFNVTKSRQLVQGYQSIRPLNDDEINAIPILCRGSAMRFFLTRLYDWINTAKDAQVRPHNPMDYWTRLNFHHQVSTPEGYGINRS